MGAPCVISPITATILKFMRYSRRRFQISVIDSGAMARCIISLTFITCVSLSAHAATLYKWVDSNGVVHYSDHLPPEESKRAHKTLTDQGITIETTAAQKTKEELAREAQLRELERQQEKQHEEARRHDQMLLDSYRDEQELIATGDEKIAAIESTINIIKGRIQRLRLQLQHFFRKAADRERSGRSVPDAILQKIAATKKKIDSNMDFIASKRQEQDELRKQFATDLQRYRELTAADHDSHTDQP